MLVRSLKICAAISGAISFLICFFLVKDALPVLRHVGIARFFTDPAWFPTEGEFNLLPMVWGSLATMVGSVLLAAPAGVASALFCHYYAPVAMARGYRRLIELLAGIPSVVFGFWGLVALVPIIARIHPPGPSLLAGILVLALMILPTIALVSDATLANIPGEYVRGAAALGISRWGAIRGVILPAARQGLYTALILGMGRAIGETMALLMVCGNVVRNPDSVFSPIRALTTNIALEMAYAMGDHRSALFASGLMLMSLVVALVLLAEFLSKGKLHA